MESEIIKRINEEQKEAVLSIPSFLNNHQETPIDVNEVEKVILNNVPGPDSKAVEEINHLNGLEQVGRNYTTEEWRRLLVTAPYDLMCDEIKRRLGGYASLSNALNHATSKLANMKL